MSFSNAFEERVLDWAFTATAVTRPTAWWVALYTTAPGEAGGGTEVSAGGYVRQQVTFARSGSTVANTGTVAFGPASADWGTVTSFALFDAIAGNLLAYATLQSQRTINNGDRGEFAAGALTVTLD
jgi:hypothetical protein